MMFFFFKLVENIFRAKKNCTKNNNEHFHVKINQK